MPKEGGTTFESLAVDCGLKVVDMRRFLRVAIARHVFKEPRIGSISHTAASRLLVDDTGLEAWILNIAQEFWPSLARVSFSSLDRTSLEFGKGVLIFVFQLVDATEKWPGSEEPNETVSLVC